MARFYHKQTQIATFLSKFGANDRETGAKKKKLVK